MQANDISATPNPRMRPNRARFWKLRVSPSLRDALAECTAYALEAHNRSVERVADLMGLDSHWTLRKYIAEVRLPVHLVRAFEHACGIDLVTRWLASSANRVCIELPHGRVTADHDVQNLQRVLNDATGALLAFYQGEHDEAQATAALTAALSELAWHRSNVIKTHQPELPL